MNVLLIGHGGRECALAIKIAESPLLTQLYVTGLNPGFPDSVIQISDNWLEDVLLHQIKLVVVGPEAPLAAGWVDRFEEHGVSVFGPSQAAARLESSKSFAKDFMERHRIPTARYAVFHEPQSAAGYIDGPCVLKADGLAAGKGVYVCSSKREAMKALEELFAGRFGEAGKTVVIEERLQGPEISVIALCDGKTVIPLLPCRDYKRRFDGDLGPNTGGMGAICPPPDATDVLLKQVYNEVLLPAVHGMSTEGAPFKGALYAGIMLTPQGPKVLEFNVRFGDPECQPLMMMLDEDILPLLLAAAQGDLVDKPLRWKDGAACCVVLSSKEYPVKSSKGELITGLPQQNIDTRVYLAGVSKNQSQLFTNGGRVLSICCQGKDLQEARSKAYQAITNIHFHSSDFRTDIGEI